MHRFILLAMLCPALCSHDALAAWNGKSAQGEFRGTQISVQDGTSNNLGVFAGIVQTKDRGGLFRSAYMVMSPHGYLMPVFTNGELAVVGPVYFKSKDCSGPEYVQASSSQPVFTGLPGTVFQVRLERTLVYIPAGSSELPITMQSFIDREKVPACITETVAGGFYQLSMNSPRVTGHRGAVFHGPLTLIADNHERSNIQTERRETEHTGSAAATVDVPDVQEECSPGCLPEDVNNGICDIACWAPACEYDGSDCNTLSQSELDERLSTICSPGCFAEDIEDGFCDALCNVDICNFDGGDCVDNQMD